MTKDFNRIIQFLCDPGDLGSTKLQGRATEDNTDYRVVTCLEKTSNDAMTSRHRQWVE